LYGCKGRGFCPIGQILKVLFALPAWGFLGLPFHGAGVTTLAFSCFSVPHGSGKSGKFVAVNHPV